MNRRGFTLLEVILALALSSLVLSAVAIAIHVHLRVLDTGRTKVEEAQLARALLRRIADDLRSAVQYEPMDVGELVSDMMLPSGDLSEMAGEMGLDAEAADEAEDIESELTDNLAESTEPPPEAGLYGNRYELQIDTSRLPRIDQFNGMLSDTGSAVIADRVSEVKTVTYYVIGAPSGAATRASEDVQNRRGLVRRQLDRATAAWAAERGELVDAGQTLQPLATEVAAIEFGYFDGTEWLDEWDSAEQGGLPVAVDIAIAIIPRNRRDEDARSASLRTTSAEISDVDDQLMVYRLLVHLPIARPTTDEDTSGTSEEPSEETPDDSAGTTDSGPAPNPPPGPGPPP